MFGHKEEPQLRQRIAPVPPGLGCGLIEGTQVATEGGWIAAETLRLGDRVLTFDGGLQEVLAVVHEELWCTIGPCPEACWPLLVPAGNIGNRNEILVLPHQGVLIETDRARDRWGDPFAVVPGAALAALPGVERLEPYGVVEVVKPVFAEDQMIFADHGALLFCQSYWGVDVGLVPRVGVPGNYNMLPLDAGLKLVRETGALYHEIARPVAA
ncbi:Hint domain-containing protein [Salinihabitans flavidus]|uniref:Hint domain-containing protein n=1 Tax=Salinihabitans flavidus TaxID=569882 RepID=A0A1H8RMZ7_9RHOB|nr:Hint domain-containing protein [Salinihabitans flavidus]SEO67735.1 Hint domain-containing protein [Salinihabitans flavidus]